MQADKKICPGCKLPMASAERRGSFTSFVFMDLHCQCDKSLKPTRSGLPTAEQRKTCKKCGKVVPDVSRPGSITSFLLKDLRCSCASIEQSSDHLLATRFRPQAATMAHKRKVQATQMHTRSTALAKDAAMVQLRPGEIIGGCYELIAPIGQGGMGLIYKAIHTTIGRTVALKFIAPHLVSKQSWELFKKEAKICSSLSHHAICQIYDLGLHSGVLPYYAMDYIDGLTLEQIVLNHGPLSMGATLEIFSKVAEGLTYAHRHGVIHKDIKPANIMVASHDNEVAIKILDFGIAELSEGVKTSTAIDPASVMGSAGYMSPEQFRGLPLDLRTDIYALGATIFESLTGSPPFQADDFDSLAQSHKTELPPLLSESTGISFPFAMDAVIQKCLQKRTDLRYQSASELNIDLQRLLQGKELQFATDQLNRVEQSRDQRSKPASSNKLLLVLTTTSLLLATGAVSYFLLNSGPGSATKNTIKTTQTVDDSLGPMAPEDTIQNFAPPKSIAPVAKSIPVRVNQYFTGLSKTVAHYTFPELPEQSIGTINLDHGLTARDGIIDIDAARRSQIVNQAPHTIPCVGSIALPVDKFKTLALTSSAAQNPYFKGFRHEDIQGLDIVAVPSNISNLVTTAAEHFPSLQRLIISQTQLEQIDPAMLSQFGKLKELALIDLDSKDSKIPDSLQLKNLEVLQLNCSDSLSTLIPSWFATSPLKQIIIDQIKLDREGMEALTIFKLDSLTIRQCSMTDDCLEPLTASNTIKHLHLIAREIKPADIKMLSIKKPTGLLSIDLYSDKVPDKTVQQQLDLFNKLGIMAKWNKVKLPPHGARS